jgi:hypothetical protein
LLGLPFISWNLPRHLSGVKKIHLTPKWAISIAGYNRLNSKTYVRMDGARPVV